MPTGSVEQHIKGGLNESPSEKEGKYKTHSQIARNRISLNESPSEKEGKSTTSPVVTPTQVSLNESPSEKEGKCAR